MFKKYFILLSLSFFAFSCAKKDHVVNLISDDVELSREIVKCFPRNCDVVLSKAGDSMDLTGCDLLWIHGVSDSSVFDGESVAEYVKRGGNLVLTSGAVMQLNHWGLESESISEWRSEGAEFAQLPFFSHPVFADISFDGQMAWSAGKDFPVYGFYGSSRPQMKDAAVLAVAYEDGVGPMNSKTVWEAPLIHGKIMAVGAGVPFGESWADRSYMKRIVSNIVAYLVDDKGNSREKQYCGTWSCDTLIVQHVHAGHHIDCKICAAEYKPVKPQRPEVLALSKSGKGRYAEEHAVIEMSDECVTLKADEVSGISEVWIDGVRIVKDYRPLVDIADVDTIVSFASCMPYLEMHKRGFTRHYAMDGVEMTEAVVLYPEHSSVVIHYQWTDPRVRQLFTEHKADLSFGYPYNGTMMSLYHVWSLQLNATVVRSHNKQFSSIVGTNVPGRSTLCGKYGDISYTDWRVRGADTDALQVASSVVYGVKGLNSMDVVISGTAEGIDALLMDYAYTLRTPKEALETVLK